VNPLVSVVVPTYNGASFVRETLESVLAQPWSPLEVIVCDDGSTDGTLAILESFGERIRVVRQANRGVAAARNRAAEEARGELIAFLDHDDVWEPAMLSTLVPLLLSDRELGLVYADAWIIDARGAFHGRRGRYLHYAEGWVFDQLLRGNFIPVETTLMRAQLFRELGGCDPSLRYLEDYELCLRVARRARIGFHPEPLARYRIHDRNLSHELEPMLVEWLRLIDGLRAPGSTSTAELTPEQRAILDEESDRLCTDLAWRAVRRRDLPAIDGWLKRAGPGSPKAKLLRVRGMRLALAALPRPAGELLVKLLPRRKLYGVNVPEPGRPELPKRE
jgi:hypothetical protein